MDTNILDKYAKTLMDYALFIEEGDYLVIQGYPEAMPLMERCYRIALQKGANPQVLLRHQLDEILLKEGSDKQLAFESPVAEAVMKNVTKLLNIGGTSNTKYLSGVDPKRIAYYRKSGERISQIHRERVERKESDWCLCMYPTNALAQEAGMSLRDYEAFIEKACLLDREDPIAAWQEVQRSQQKIVDYLTGKKTLEIRSEDTHITMSVEDRIWINSDGHTNFPSGEVFTAPVEDSVEGHIRFSYPGIYAGQEIEDIRLTFEKGKVVEAKASKGEGLLQALIQTDQGASRVGEVAIGTNYGIQQFTRNMLYDEKIGGTVHLALGSAYGKSGGKNKSAIHWDMLCDMKQGGDIYADGILFYQNGKFIDKPVR
ncbi:aminopeptidase [Alkalibacter rhizosphaerae]|uniref:Aminopeptidase n=1 Tax=Alkalibacter rhizosphaerae TaxID=2815577 RepID=A0A974XDE8_9FIRM|nr:aminopeptidase [Alkalibacter rhizosphaerae]QSX07797.1 aminopeptidase [Alkalibacter rhizosphaerae]